MGDGDDDDQDDDDEPPSRSAVKKRGLDGKLKSPQDLASVSGVPEILFNLHIYFIPDGLRL